MLILGSAQFGLRYAGSDGEISKTDLVEILDVARQNGINEIDTASGYGVAECRLGDAGCASFLVNSKLPPRLHDSCVTVKSIVVDSIKRLNVSNLNTLYIHDTESFLNHPNSDEIYDDLLKCVKEGLISKIGVSVYHSDELKRFWQKYSCDVIQGPFNYFDDRLAAFIEKSRVETISLQYRSLFLQGTLVNKALRSNLPFKKRFRFFDQTVRASQYSDNLSFCMAYARQNLVGNGVIVGIRNAKDLKEIIINYDQGHRSATIQRNRYINSDYNLVNPYLWSRE